jgi:hypothetical protein
MIDLPTNAVLADQSTADDTPSITLAKQKREFARTVRLEREIMRK